MPADGARALRGLWKFDKRGSDPVLKRSRDRPDRWTGAGIGGANRWQRLRKSAPFLALRLVFAVIGQCGKEVHFRETT